MTSEYLQFDDEDQENSNARSRISPYGPAEDPYNNRIYYCYYEPSKVQILTMIITLIVKLSISWISLILRKSSVISFGRLFGIFWYWLWKLLAIKIHNCDFDSISIKKDSDFVAHHYICYNRYFSRWTNGAEINFYLFTAGSLNWTSKTWPRVKVHLILAELSQIPNLWIS